MAGAALLHVAPRPRRELAGVGLAGADDRRDLVVGVVEHLAQQERGPLLGREALEHDEEGQRQRVGELGLRGGLILACDQRLGQPLADVRLAPGAGRAQLIDAEAGDDGGDPGRRRVDPLAAGERAVQAQQGLLHHVLVLARAAQHAVRHREGARAQLLVEVAAGHAARSPSANPWRQLG